MVVLVSKCLLGENCRYKGDCCYSEKVAEFIKDKEVVGICPEQDGGLPTPREPAERQGDRIINRIGEDVTEEYNTGARRALALAREKNVDLCILKAKSPSCGKGKIYDGSFTGNLVDGMGVTAELLEENGFRVLSEEDL